MKDNNIKKLPVVLNNEIVGVVTETDITQIIEVFSEAINELEQFYVDTKNNIDNMMDEWKNIIYKLKGSSRQTDTRQSNVIKEKITY